MKIKVGDLVKVIEEDRTEDDYQRHLGKLMRVTKVRPEVLHVVRLDTGALMGYFLSQVQLVPPVKRWA